MHASRLGRAAVLAAGLLVGSPLSAEEPLTSGPQPGETLPGSFEPLNVTGEYAGERYCLVCAAGLKPTVMIFARTLTDATLAFLTRLEAATKAHSKQRLVSFAIFLSDAPELDQQLADAAEEHGLATTTLAIDEPSGPEGYGLVAEADVTVVLYKSHIVQASHAFRPGELDDEAVDRILADLSKILPPE